jgi:hypothetical protein
MIALLLIYNCSWGVSITPLGIEVWNSIGCQLAQSHFREMMHSCIMTNDFCYNKPTWNPESVPPLNLSELREQCHWTLIEESARIPDEGLCPFFMNVKSIIIEYEKGSSPQPLAKPIAAPMEITPPEKTLESMKPVEPMSESKKTPG